MVENYELNPHPIVRYLKKSPREFTKDDIIRYVVENHVEMINFRYPGADGRLKTLNFIINDLEYLETILTCGERVDGSSLFPYIEAGASDLYVIPRYRTAFLNPFSEIPAVDMLCSFYTKDGKPLDMSPEYVMRRAHEELKRVTGMEYEVMGELEYYVISKLDDLFLASDQRGYHESTPFNKGAELRAKAMQYIASTNTGNKEKVYSHVSIRPYYFPICIGYPNLQAPMPLNEVSHFQDKPSYLFRRYNSLAKMIIYMVIYFLLRHCIH